MNRMASLLVMVITMIFQSNAIGQSANKLSLCDEKEIVVFSCTFDNGYKTHSICAAVDKQTNTTQAISYRLGVNRKNIELNYPKKPMPVDDAFSFMSRKSFNEGDIEILSFSMGNTTYDVMMPENVEYMRDTFLGLEITHPKEPAELYECDKGSIFIDLKPINSMLRLPGNGRFYESLPKRKIADPAFPMVSKDATDAKGFKTSISYPRTGIAEIDSEIARFANCDSELNDDFRVSGSLCSREVSAKIVDEKFLVFYFQSYEYGAGAAHGSDHIETRIYRKHNQGWESLKPQELFTNSEYCRNKIGRLIVRQLRPLEIPSLDDENGGEYSDPKKLFDEAYISFVEQGILFGYHQYQLGGYIPPPDTLISWKSLGSCLRQY